MTDDPASGWQVEMTLPGEACLPAFEMALEEVGGAVAAREVDGGPRWRLIAHCQLAPDRASLETRVAIAAAIAGIDPPPVTIVPVPETDWVADYRRRTRPVAAGPFFVYPSHHEDGIPAGRIGIRLDAGLAFGTGEHETTRGCLLALQRLHIGGMTVRRALDMGCGSAILAIAIAKLWPDAAVVAVDNDPEAVRTAAQNVADNGCAATVEVAEGEGYAGAVAADATYELIVANILARPLIALAPRAADHLAPAGHIILSGVLSTQAARVQAAHAQAGLALADRIVLGDWTTLIMRRPV